MGNREALLDGAKRCLRENGFSRTTARDVASASGVSLAAIGYHFGSKEALLSQALIEATGEWVGELERAVEESLAPDAPLMQRFETIWARLLELFAAHRQLWAANFEISPQIEQMPEVRHVFAEAQQQARLGLAKLFQGLEPADPSALPVGSFYYALLTGVMAQWLIDPERAPSASDLVGALRLVTSRGRIGESPP
jgi:AcrR family transcriptional regulator